MSLLYRFQRHPLAMEARFAHSLVLTYALPAASLESLLPPGLSLDTFDGFGFLAIALVDTRAMRPRALPAMCGFDSYLAGYRIFTRLGGARSLRGLRILHSQTDRFPMLLGGNLLTHYQYTLSDIHVAHQADCLRWRITTDNHEADLDVTADLASSPAKPPKGSPFQDWREARRFAGPLPYTFDYEPETHSIIRIQGVRQSWIPRPVEVRVARCTFLERFSAPTLANAFYIPGVPSYSWRRGVRVPLPGQGKAPIC
jgi:hypothetical protein